MASYITYPPLACGCTVRVQTDRTKLDAKGQTVPDPLVEIAYCAKHQETVEVHARPTAVSHRPARIK